jgi:hypothetical protein
MKRADWYLEGGQGRAGVCLAAHRVGEGLVVYLYNENAHLGAIAVAQFDTESGRVSVSTITLLGHKDDAVAQRAAYLVGKATQRPVCAIAGIHLDDITPEEIEQIQVNAEGVVKELVEQLHKP